jgi:hypothetical protein
VFHVRANKHENIIRKTERKFYWDLRQRRRTIMSKPKMHTHRRRVGKGLHAAKRRRQGALDRLLEVKEPNKRQLAEIETLQSRTSRG